MSELREERPEWYERLRTDDAFPGRTFTPEAMDRIERRVRAGESRWRRLRWRIGAAGAAACAVALAAWFVLAGPLRQGEPVDGGLRSATPNTPAVTEPVESVSPSSSTTWGVGPIPDPIPSSGVKQSNVKYLKGDVMVHVEPGPNGAYSPFVALPTETYSIGETRDGYVQITNGAGQTGWIPEWYSTDEASGHRIVNFADPYVMIVDKPVKYRLYPGEQTPSGFELWAGKVVQVVGRYEDWLEINVVTYDSPYMENKWVRQDELIPYEDNMANEGYVGLQEAPLYDENGKVTQKITPITNVYIEGEQGDRYRIIAAGGISGYIDKKDFVPNPFSFRVIDQ